MAGGSADSAAAPKSGDPRRLNVNVGILGHIDSGKTALARALSTIGSTAAFNRAPQSRARGITLDLGFSCLCTELPPHLGPEPGLLQLTLVDCPGRTSLIHTIIGDNSIRNMVTITIKAFLRYHKLRILLKSIKRYYPDITIIVADDSEHPEKIEEANVQHYIMPFGKGWFAGRNLAISQVTTKYYLWVDDDFIFTEKTKIEKFVDVLENSNLDVVGGSVDGNEYKFKIFYQEGEDSSCLHLRYGFYHRLEGFPNCVVTSGVVNFFLAHTEESRRVGFDPKLQRVAHLEFFMDGLGSLRVGSCNDVSIGHQSHQISTNEQEAKVEHLYARFRNSVQKEIKFKLSLHYFKNRMKCYSKG